MSNMTKQRIALLALLATTLNAAAQLKPRPDAFPAEVETIATKAITMATTVEEMSSWDRYPTYDVYLEMMQRWASNHPDLCRLDTIGTSVQGRLILALDIMGDRDCDIARPEFFYTSTIHGDEVTGYVMMLRLIDTLLTSYGQSGRLTDLVNETHIFINPLANPDGTYRRGNHTVQGSIRYNANYVDLNRTFPDPFSGTSAKALQPENQAMVDYASSHNFRMSANLHGGSEVLNYPWDSFTSTTRPHPEAEWWKTVCQRFVDTCRVENSSYMTDVEPSGFIAGGDWYVIPGGRQDYMNYYHNCLELTLEVSTTKTLSAEQLPAYWHYLHEALINYIGEVHTAPNLLAIDDITSIQARIYPNPATSRTIVCDLPTGATARLYDMQGRHVASYLIDSEPLVLDLQGWPSGLYLLRADNVIAKIIKR